MDHTVNSLLWCGGAGWVLLMFAVTLGAGKSVASVLFSTVFSCLILIDLVASLLGMVTPVVQHAHIGWKFVCFLVIAPYVVSILRLYWWYKRRPWPAGNSATIE